MLNLCLVCVQKKENHSRRSVYRVSTSVRFEKKEWRALPGSNVIQFWNMRNVLTTSFVIFCTLFSVITFSSQAGREDNVLKLERWNPFS